MGMTPQQFRQLREKMGLTQSKFGTLLGIDKMSVWRKENGQRPITRRDIVILAPLLRKYGGGK